MAEVLIFVHDRVTQKENGMKSRFFIKQVVGLMIIGISIIYLISAIQSSWAYYISVDEYCTDQDVQAHKARVGGVVAKDSVDIDLEQVRLTFVLAGQSTSMPVAYYDVIPDNFAEDREVLVEGLLDAEGVFQADKLITKCESKYQAKVREK